MSGDHHTSVRDGLYSDGWFRAVCTCGWESVIGRTRSEAIELGDRHGQTQLSLRFGDDR